MAKLKAFTNTTVNLMKTQDEAERILAKHGIAASRWTHLSEQSSKPGTIIFEFQTGKAEDGTLMGIRMIIQYQYESGPKGGNKGTTREQAGRALFWHLKNLLDAVDFGIVEMEEAFLPYLLTDSGETFYERAKPVIQDALRSGRIPLLLPNSRGENS